MGFRILSVNNAGTFGTVVQVQDPSRGDRVIGLKVLNRDFITDDRVLRRTRDEARLLSQLSHPNILRVFGLRQYSGWPIIEMEWVDGITIHQLLKAWSEGLPAPIAIDITRTLCAALDHAFNQCAGTPAKPLHLVHRDLKPTNVMIGRNGVVKLIDFGLAYGEFQNRESITVSMVLGTRRYLAPERLDGEEDTPKGDVYAIGIMLLEMLIGKALKLSVNPRHHRARLKEALTFVPADRLNNLAGQRLFSLISQMVAYDAEDRPTHRKVVQELGTVMAVGKLSPNITSFAQAYIAPIMQHASTPNPQAHPMYSQVRFLEDEPFDEE
jgi:serine/threonine protein kinase